MSEQSRTPDDAGSPAAVMERAKMGEEILGARVARGEPGEKQPAHDDPRLSASKTVEKLDEIVKQFEAEVHGPSMERAKEGGNLHPIPPEDRKIQRGPMVLQAAATAAGAIGAARDALATQLEADARLVSDPRYERDQKVYELGQMGKLQFVPPTEAEVITAASRSGTPEEALDRIPKTPQEQVAQDMPRLEAAEKRSVAAINPTVDQAQENKAPVSAGEQELAEKNNGGKAQAEGRTGKEAEARAKAQDAAAASSSAPRPVSGTRTNEPQGTPIPVRAVPDKPQGTPIRSESDRPTDPSDK